MPKLDFTVEPTGALVDATMPPIEVTARGPLGDVDTGFNGSVTVAFLDDPTGGSATLTGTTTVSAASGVALFADLSVDQAGVGFTLEATQAASSRIRVWRSTSRHP